MTRNGRAGSSPARGTIANIPDPKHSGKHHLIIKKRMKSNLISRIAVIALGVVAFSSCSKKLGPLTADNFNVDPEPLELVGSQVPVTINGTFPEKYMHKKAVITVTPELRNATGKVIRGEGQTFQGEKVLGNDQSISYLLGGRYTMRDAFDYTDDMHKSELYLTFAARIGKKIVSVPDVKVGTGVIATAGLYKQALVQGGGIIAPDTFQRVRKAKQEASIMFLINQATLRQSELKNNSVQEFVKLLQSINADAKRYNLGDIEVKAYASPDGGQKVNEKLAVKRQSVSEDYVDEQLKKTNLATSVTGEYTAQDWEGFQQLVAASNIQDKELILRVLNMYKDPEEREEQIKHLSLGFQDLTKQILPQLRRARMIINYEAVGRSDEEIAADYATKPDSLSVDEILYYASTVDNMDQKEAIYKKCAQIYPNDYRAFNNVAACEFAKNNDAEVRAWVNKTLQVNPRAAECQSNLALVELKNGNLKEAEAYMAKAGSSNDINRVQGAINFVKGNYKQAAADYKGVVNNMAGLASIMAGDYSQGRATFKAIKNPDAMTSYLHSICCYREGSVFSGTDLLKDALQKDPSLKAYADEDLEFTGE